MHGRDIHSYTCACLQSRNARAPGKAAAKPQVAELLDRINTVEAGLRTAEALNMAAASRAGAEAHSAAVAELRKGGKSPEPRPSR
jgi:glycerol-3-phosphate dehydrogenase